jgi:hypothetical protein
MTKEKLEISIATWFLTGEDLERRTVGALRLWEEMKTIGHLSP